MTTGQIHPGTPLVSAIVSTYNSERFIEGCLHSLLQQTLVDYLEILVVVSGSREGELPIVRRCQERNPNIRLLHTFQREGLYTAWNRAVRLARGKYLVNANTDDRLHPQAYEKLVSVLEARPEISLVYADWLKTEEVRDWTEASSAKEVLETQDYSHFDLLRWCFIGPGPMWRRKLHSEIGCFNDHYKSGADYEFWLRTAARYPMIRLREPLGIYLERTDSLAHLPESNQETIAIQRSARRNVPLESVFPFLNESDDPYAPAYALAAMAEVCMVGPWHVDVETAMDYLDKAAAEGAPGLMIDNNRAIMLALAGQKKEAILILEKHRGEEAAENNLKWLAGLEKEDSSLRPAFIKVRHPVVDAAQLTHGINPEELILLQVTAVEKAAFPRAAP